MHIILTHEQADFDAIAALLGASLRSEHAIPVLPRRMNRNVRSFLNLYSSELPFYEARDLPPGNPIQIVTLVDTQSLTTLKGLHPGSRVYVIDHHPLRSDLSPDWTVSTETVGACTTRFVELLREHNSSLTLVQATLLLLGIYEDTGSLTYVSTTPRDVRAAAYLLEQGASLSLLADFLDPPLSSAQREIYNQLMNTAQTFTIHSQQILVSAVEALEMTEEISSIAHKLRDLLDPDALFLIVRTTEGIRIVSRSTSDQVNVAQLLKQFGGGGHPRAASALLKVIEGHPTLQKVQSEILQQLPLIVRPSITVGQIMSSRPLTLTPETPVQKAAELMQRYGYEGYPIMQHGKVIGLLTRRAVDRALTHKLNLPVSSLMEAGEIQISPHEPIEALQRLMSSTGWGQVPVTDPQTGKLLGIVTRTDLLKTLGHSSTNLPGRQNLSKQLETALPPAHLALLQQIAAQAQALNLPAYIVGGFVRDLLLERPSLDFDIVIEGDAIALAHSLCKQFGGRLITHSRFGTAKWQIAEVRPSLLAQLHHASDPDRLPESLDLISARTEFYDHPTALPTVERSSIKLDLHRRDFTINTLALRLDGRHYGDLYDYWGGLNDLRKGQVRVLHSLSFVDDPTRMLRAVRFEQRFGFTIEQRTLQLMDEARDLLRQLSGDRLRHEFDLIFAEQRPAAMLERLQQLDLLSPIHPALTWQPTLSTALHKALHSSPPAGWQLPPSTSGQPSSRLMAYLIWLATLPLEAIVEISLRLKFSRPLRLAIQITAKLWQQFPSLLAQPPSQAYAQLKDAPTAALYALYLLSPTAEGRALLHHCQTEWQHIQPFTTAAQLQALGLPPGPRYTAILNTLRNAHLDGVLHSQADEEALLQTLLTDSASYGNTPPNLSSRPSLD